MGNISPTAQIIQQHWPISGPKPDDFCEECGAEFCYDDDNNIIPGMWVTVSGNGAHPISSSSSSSGQTISWCREEWKPENDGDRKFVCPSHYIYGRSELYHRPRNHKEAIFQWGIGGLFIEIEYKKRYKRSTEFSSSTYYSGSNSIRLGIRTSNSTGWEHISDRGYNTWMGVHTHWWSHTPISRLGGMIQGAPEPSFDDYHPTEAYFGSHEIDGVTYTWEKASGWN